MKSEADSDFFTLNFCSSSKGYATLEAQPLTLEVESKPVEKHSPKETVAELSIPSQKEQVTPPAEEARVEDETLEKEIEVSKTVDKKESFSHASKRSNSEMSETVFRLLGLPYKELMNDPASRLIDEKFKGSRNSLSKKFPTCFYVPFAETWRASEAGVIDEPWLIVERHGDVAVDPKRSRTTVRTV